jgi:hypothetical protein
MKRLPNSAARQMLSLLSAMSIAISMSGLKPPPVTAVPGSYTYETFGFDRACAPSNAQMDAFWSGSPYYHMAVYIGGLSIVRTIPTLLRLGWIAMGRLVRNGD